MQRILFVVVLMFSLIAGHAQSKDCEEQIANLTQKVESLESEVAYLKLINELSASRYEINISSNEVYSRAKAIEVDILFNKFDQDIGAVNYAYYVAAQHQFDSTENLARMRIAYAKMMLEACDFSQIEKEIINSYCDNLDSGLNSLKETLALLKLNVEEYSKHI